MNSISAHGSRHPPRCLSNFRVAHAEAVADKAVQFRIVGSDSETEGSVTGHSLEVLNKNYQGPSLFVSPLTLLWKGAKAPAALLDTAMHGYHGEMRASATLRGSSTPSTYKCPQCGGTWFRFDATFRYWDAALDLWEDEPEIAIEDYFNGFSLSGKCTTCGTDSTISEMEKL